MPALSKSPWLIHYDASSCNGCDIETLACLTPLYDVERLGVLNTGNPKHADIFLVTGAVNEQSQAVIRNIYHQLPEPKVVVAVGICACSGGIFRECYNISGGVDSVIPVDVYVPGCAARPEAIIDGVVKALAVLEEKHREMKAIANSLDQTLYLPAEKADAPEILALQKIAYQSEAELYGDDSLPALQQTLEDLENDFERMPQREATVLGARGSSDHSAAAHDRILFLKAVVNGKIIGSVRGYTMDDTAYLSRLNVHPYFRKRGIGRRLLAEIEQAFPHVSRFETKTGHQSKRNLYQLAKRRLPDLQDRAVHPHHHLGLSSKGPAAGPRGKQRCKMSNAADQPVQTIPLQSLLQKAGELRQEGYRLVQIGATRLPEQVEITYSFDRDGCLVNLRFQLLAAGARLPSISSIYWCAFLYENEMHDLFNVQVDGMAVDFHGHLYETAVKFPFGSTKAPSAKPAGQTPGAAGGAPAPLREQPGAKGPTPSPKA